MVDETGGVSVYIGNKYVVEVIEECTLSQPSIECLFLKVSYRNITLILGTAYKPKGSKKEFIQGLTEAVYW